jgi:tRNA(Leu) C34 or U34 (ribose-2'-O)-methylase TrmL
MVVVLATLLFLRTRQLPEKAEYQFQNCHFLLTNQENASLDDKLHQADHSNQLILLKRETI